MKIIGKAKYTNLECGDLNVSFEDGTDALLINTKDSEMFFNKQGVKALYEYLKQNKKRFK
jgi:hypothetical protein